MMKYVIVLLCIAGLLAAGYLLMKKLDGILAQNRENTAEQEKRSPFLRIAFENPVMAASVSEGLREFSQKHPECRMLLFSGPADRIRRQLRNGEMDIGILRPDPAGREENAVPIPLVQAAVYTELLDEIPIEPLPERQQLLCLQKGEGDAPWGCREELFALLQNCGQREENAADL